MRIADILRHKNDHTGDGAESAAADRPPIVTITPDEPVTRLVAALAEHRIGALVVVRAGDGDGDGGQQVAGIVSERDVVRRLHEHGAGVLDGPVSAIMTTMVASCTSEDSVDAIAETMTARRIRHIPVIDDGRLRGIVSIGDIVSSRIRQLENDRGQLEQYITG